MQTSVIFGFLLLAYFQICSGDDGVRYFSFSTSDLECFRELGMDKQIIWEAFDVNYLLEEGNEKVNEFVTCTFKKTNYLNADGSPNFENLKKWVRSEFFIAVNRPEIENKDKIVDKAMTACESVEGKNVGDTAVKIYNCLMNHILLA